MLTRRNFLRQNLGSMGLLPLVGSVPLFITRSLAGAEPQSSQGRVLVVVELGGGNDGINTVVPHADEYYPRFRRTLRLPKERLIKLNDRIGLHPALRGMADLWEDNWLSVVQGVGYPNPSRSHFQSMAIWHTADLAAEQHAGLGWIGRGLDQVHRPPDGPLAMSVGPQDLPLALRGRRVRASSMYRLEQFHLPEAGRNFLLPDPMVLPQHDLRQFVLRTTADMRRTAEQLRHVSRADSAAERYPGTALAGHLRLTARLIRAELGVRVFYAQQPGYDTHAGQLPQHDVRLQELGDALKAFFADLDAAGLADQVVVLAFSEFGRRVEENASGGTDHGTAGPVFVAGPAVHVGLVGDTPLLSDLDDGDLKMSLDFRQVYATILEDWLGVPPEPVLGAGFATLPLFS